MRFLYFLLAIVYLNCCTTTNELEGSILSSKHGEEYVSYDSVLLDLKEKSELAIIAGTIGYSGTTRSFTIISKQNGIWHKYQYSTIGYITLNNTRHLYNEEKISSDLCDSIVNQLKDMRFWNIADKVDWLCFRDESQTPIDTLRRYICNIHDAPTSTIITFYERRVVNVKEYYAPEYLNSCCPKNMDRDVFMRAYRILSPQSRSW